MAIFKRNIIPILLLIIAIIAGVFIFSRMWNVMLEIPEFKSKSLLLYFYLFILIIILIAFYLIIRNLERMNKTLIHQKEELENLVRLKTKEDHTDTSQNEQDEILQLANSMLPDDNLLNEPEKYGESCLIKISKITEIVQGILYITGNDNSFRPIATYAYYSNTPPSAFKLGETIPGQVAKDMKPLVLNDIPDKYITILSGLGQGSPKALFILPVLFENKTIAVFELASFKKFDIKTQETFVKFAEIISEKLKTMTIE